MTGVRESRTGAGRARDSHRAASTSTPDGMVVPRLLRSVLLVLFGILPGSLAGFPAAAQSGETESAPAEPPAGIIEPYRPPERVIVADTRNDAGRSLTVTWTLSPDDTPDRHGFSGYRVLRAAAAEGPYLEIGRLPRGMIRFIDTEGLRDGVPYWYRVAAEGVTDGADDPAPRPSGLSPSIGPTSSRAQWFHTGRVNMLVAVLTLSGLVLYYIRRAERGGHIFIRKIAGLEAVDEAVGRATEMGRTILFVPGTQDMDQVQTLAGIAILGRVARLTAEYETALSVPVSRSLVMVACRETVKEAYLATGRPEGYSDDMVFYLTDDQFGYAAALEGIMVREKPAAIFMQGSFFAESLILAETGNAIGAIQIAGTAQASQLPFFVAACDYTLIGEELFVAGAYLSKEPRQLGSLKGQDIGKAILLVLMLVGIVVQSTGLVDFARLFRVE